MSDDKSLFDQYLDTLEVSELESELPASLEFMKNVQSSNLPHVTEDMVVDLAGPDASPVVKFHARIFFRTLVQPIQVRQRVLKFDNSSIPALHLKNKVISCLTPPSYKKNDQISTNQLVDVLNKLYTESKPEIFNVDLGCNALSDGRDLSYILDMCNVAPIGSIGTLNIMYNNLALFGEENQYTMVKILARVRDYVIIIGNRLYDDTDFFKKLAYVEGSALLRKLIWIPAYQLLNKKAWMAVLPPSISSDLVDDIVATHEAYYKNPVFALNRTIDYAP